MMSPCDQCGLYHEWNEPCSEPDPPDSPSEASDGYHDLAELYEHRHALFIALCLQNTLTAWRSKYHDDGKGKDGWFIAGLTTLAGPISYHLPISYWDKLDFAITRDRAPKWDGHTSKDVVARLLKSCERTHREGFPSSCGVYRPPIDT